MCECCGAHSINGLAHIGIFCRDIVQSKSFYTDILGFELDHEAELASPEGPIKTACVKSGDLVIILSQSPEGRPEAGSISINHFALNTSNIPHVFAHMKADGVDVEPGEITSLPGKDVKHFYLRGPDGERIELVEPHMNKLSIEHGK
ncbi:MAG: VOC family protein [Bacillota bacterium]|nr:VOC family protein [Bacillota bacterium]